jgi:formylglycine-generating enzyme required for sulfatase activity
VRFVNWLQNGQGSGDTESGTYTITNGGLNSGTVLVPDATTRIAWASTGSFHWLLPSEDEWYKAAYYSAPGGAYYAYPFKSNSVPAAVAPPGNSNSGNFRTVAHNYDGTGSYVTDVGSYSNSISPFGSFDMGGDVYQWNEATIGSSRGVRGGYWMDIQSASAASTRAPAVGPTTENFAVGFRVASVPEPSTALLAALACGVIWLGRKRFKPFA